MKVKELIEKLQSANLEDADVVINFTLLNDAAFIYPIVDIAPECGDLNIFINIGDITADTLKEVRYALQSLTPKKERNEIK